MIPKTSYEHLFRFDPLLSVVMNPLSFLRGTLLVPTFLSHGMCDLNGSKLSSFTKLHLVWFVAISDNKSTEFYDFLVLQA